MLDERSLPPDALAEGLRDLVALLALPSMCHGRSPAAVLDTVADVLASMARLDLVYLRLGTGADAVDAARLAGCSDVASAMPDVRRSLSWLLEPPVTEHEMIDDPLGGEGRLSVLIVPVGFYSRAAVMIAGSARRDFPRPLEAMVVRAAASVAAAAIENAVLLELAREADRRKDEFLALLGHELRNPLAPILTALQLLDMKNVGGARERGIIERQVRHMIQLVDDLLDISRITKGKLVLSCRRIDVLSVVQRAVELASPAIEARRHSLHVQVPASLSVFADPIRLAQVFSNLLTNAAKFTEPGGSISIVGRAEGDRVVVSVKDTGRGIDARAQERIFEAFVQVDRSHDALAGGLGLGLAIVRSLVLLHQGTVRVASEGAGRGSEFTVELPAHADAPREGEAEHGGASGDRVKSRKRVLVVDDNADAAELLSEALRSCGADVRVAKDGLAGLELARRFRPDVALVDIGLPVMDGYAVASELRREFGPELRLVSVSGYAEEASRRRSREAGFDAHLVKPVDLDAILAAIEASVSR